MSDDRRDDGFDLFDLGAPDDSSEPESTPDDASPEESEEQPLEDAESEPGSSRRFAEFMQAMSDGLQPTGDPDAGFDADVETADGPQSGFGSESPGDTSGTHPEPEAPPEGRSRYAQFRELYEAGDPAAPVISDTGEPEPVEQTHSAFEPVEPEPVPAETSAADLAAGAAVDEAEAGGGRFAEFMGAMSGGAVAGAGDDTDAAHGSEDPESPDPLELEPDTVELDPGDAELEPFDPSPFEPELGEPEPAGTGYASSAVGDEAELPGDAVADGAEPPSGRFAEFMGAMSGGAAAGGAGEPEASDPGDAELEPFDPSPFEPEGEPEPAGTGYASSAVSDEAELPDDAVADEAEPPSGRFAEFMGAMAGDATGGEPFDTPGPADLDSDPPDAGSDWETFTDEQYIKTTTQEYSGLAEELARTAREPTEPSAVAADIPGLESGVVGLDDVAGEHAGAELHVRTAADVGLRVLTGVGLLILFGASLISPVAIGALAAVVFMLAAGEFSAVLVRSGYRPFVPLTLLATLGCLLGTWVWGVIAIPVTLSASLIALGLVFGVAPPERPTSVDAGLTVLVAAWIGGLGAFVFPMLESGDYRWLISGIVLAIVSMDVGQYFVGRRFGSRPLAPVVSPKKTVEGLFGGAMTAVVLSLAFAFLAPYDYATAMLLAVAAIVLGPLGDLSVSLVKRILGIKDMGTVLPGHGGILDRIDGLLFVIPAAWVIFRVAGFLT